MVYIYYIVSYPRKEKKMFLKSFVPAAAAAGVLLIICIITKAWWLLWLMPVIAAVLFVANKNAADGVLDSEELEKEMIAAKQWITASLEASGYKVDFSLESLNELERFFDEQNTPRGILARHTGRIIFAIAVYLGETLIANIGGKWLINECKNEMEIKVKLSDGSIIFPGQKVVERYQKKRAFNLYEYGKNLRKDTEK